MSETSSTEDVFNPFLNGSITLVIASKSEQAHLENLCTKSMEAIDSEVNPPTDPKEQTLSILKNAERGVMVIFQYTLRVHR